MRYRLHPNPALILSSVDTGHWKSGVLVLNTLELAVAYAARINQTVKILDWTGRELGRAYPPKVASCEWSDTEPKSW